MKDLPNQPSFIYRGGDMLKHAPFQQQNTRMYGFFVEGELNKLQACIDRDLNAVAAGKYHFKPLSNCVMLTFADIQHCYSSNPQDINKGWGVEVDVCFWVPVGNFVVDNGKERLDCVYWYTPYIWVNSPIAMVNGRDIYGYPKTIGQIELPKPDAPNHFKIAVNSFKTYTKETESEWNELLNIKNLAPGASLTKRWDNFIDAAKGIFELAKGEQRVIPDINALEQITTLLTEPQLPQIFLKQIPDNHGNKAAYQALLSAPAKVNSFEGGGPLLGDYQIVLQDIASIPIAQDLGIKVGAQPSIFNFWMDFGFEVPAAETLVNNSYIPKKKKIAILGGGVSSCTAAFALTSQPGWQDRYDITLYQLGWRLGGKGASGRNEKLGDRIEEHGLHIWLGFYRNAFKYIQEVYAEWDRPEGAPLSTWDGENGAFKPHSFIVHMEHFNDEWTPWCLNFPMIDGDPGKGPEAVTMWNLIKTIYAYMKDWLGDLRQEIKLIESTERAAKSRKPRTLSQRWSDMVDWIDDTVDDTTDDVERLLKGAGSFIESLPDEITEHQNQDINWIKVFLEEIKEWIEEEATEYLEDHANIRHLFIGIDLAITVTTGMIRDNIFNDGYDVINNLDFRQWLRDNGANEKFTVQSTTVRALYDLIFAYEDGDIEKPNCEAGTMLRGMLRIGMCYRGGIMWKMQAGMGDTIFSPYYEVLKKRGVKFEFFNEVDELLLDPNNLNTVQKIKITQQVKLKKETYQPLINVKDIPCWPSQPRYDQIDAEQAKLLQDNDIDLENYWNRWPEIYQQHYGTPLPTKTLIKGEDFDEIICGISIAALPSVCPQLLEQSPALKACHDNVKTVVTQAYQLWTNPNLPELGWSHYSDTGEQPVMTSWTEPVDTWAAMNQLLDKENWGALGQDPQNVAYYCGVQPVTAIPPRTDYEFPIQAKAKVKQACLNQMNHETYSLWPNAATPETFNFNLLTDPYNQQGDQRFNSQYWRSNTAPTERYVQSVVNSTQYRIDTDGAGFDNIYFTGDWIKTGLNAGCVEGATMAGLQTSRAMCGYPAFIYGEHDFGKVPTVG